MQPVQVERRRESRFEAKLWVGIPEAEGEAELERCNISATGMLLRTSRDAGSPGAVRMLRLVSADLGASIEIMAHVVRVVACEDSKLGRVIEATVFEFLPHHPLELENFLVKLFEGEVSVPPAGSVYQPDRVSIGDLPGGSPSSSSSTLNVSGMVIDANRALEVGTRVALEIELPSSSSTLRLWGRVVESRSEKDDSDDELYRIEVSFDGRELGDRSEQAAVADVAADTLSCDAATGGGRERQGLSGALSEVALPSLLGFFELERVSGVLRLEHDGKTACLFVRDGYILDVESEPATGSAKDALADLFSWPDGAFEFSSQSVERENAIGQSTTALLMDCARLSDENSQQS